MQSRLCKSVKGDYFKPDTGIDKSLDVKKTFDLIFKNMYAVRTFCLSTNLPFSDIPHKCLQWHAFLC